MRVDMLTEKELIRACIGKDQNAWKEFCDRFNPLITSVIRKIFFSFGFELSGNVEDAVQYSYIALVDGDYKRLRAFKGNSKFSTYLRVVVHNICLDYIRKSNPGLGTIKVVPLFYEPSSTPSVIDDIEKAEEQEYLRKAIEELPAKAKIMIKLFYSGKRMGEIAGILKVPMGTVESSIHRSVEEIKKIISGKLKETGIKEPTITSYKQGDVN